MDNRDERERYAERMARRLARARCVRLLNIARIAVAVTGTIIYTVLVARRTFWAYAPQLPYEKWLITLNGLWLFAAAIVAMLYEDRLREERDERH